VGVRHARAEGRNSQFRTPWASTWMIRSSGTFFAGCRSPGCAAVSASQQARRAGLIQPLLQRGLDGAIYGFGVDTGMHLLAIITSGCVPIRFPKLKIVVGPPGRGHCRSGCSDSTTCTVRRFNSKRYCRL